MTDKELEERVNRILKDAEAAAMSETIETTLATWVAKYQDTNKALTDELAKLREDAVPREVYDSLMQNFQSYRREALEKISQIPRLKEQLDRLRDIANNQDRQIRGLRNAIGETAQE